MFGHIRGTVSKTLTNLWALKFLLLNKVHIFQCMVKIFYMDFQRVPLKVHTKYLNPYIERCNFHTLLKISRVYMCFWDAPQFWPLMACLQGTHNEALIDVEDCLSFLQPRHPYLITRYLNFTLKHYNKTAIFCFVFFCTHWHCNIILLWGCGQEMWFNSLWPVDAIWRYRSKSTLVQVMACFLMASSHYPNQCWLINDYVLWHSHSRLLSNF